MNRRKPTTWRARNPVRMRALREKWRNENLDRAREQSRVSATKSRKGIKAAIRALMKSAKSAPCLDCGITFDPICMDFDHRPGELKIGNVSQLRTIADITAEIAKCDVVCSNCHRLRTKRRGQWGAWKRPRPTVEVTQLTLEDML